MAKRIVGIDLAVTGLHCAAVYDSVSVVFVGKSFTFNRSYEGFCYSYTRQRVVSVARFYLLCNPPLARGNH